MFSTPTLAKIAVSAAKQAESSAQVCQVEKKAGFMECLSPCHRQLLRDRLAQNARQRLHRIRLLDQLEAAMGVLREHVAVAGGEHDGQAGIALADDAGELD